DNYTFAQPGIQRKVKALEELVSRIDDITRRSWMSGSVKANVCGLYHHKDPHRTEQVIIRQGADCFSPRCRHSICSGNNSLSSAPKLPISTYQMQGYPDCCLFSIKGGVLCSHSRRMIC
ncbi:hypothetical protein GOODEAATRI_006091, partial [Goodea atripinnis]